MVEEIKDVNESIANEKIEEEPIVKKSSSQKLSSRKSISKEIKKEYIVLNIIGKDFILLDEAKNGIRLAIPKGLENVSIGDKISL